MYTYVDRSSLVLKHGVDGRDRDDVTEDTDDDEIEKQERNE